MRRFGILGLLVAIALVTAACGGDDALSRDEYIAQGNAICEDSNAQIEAIFLEVFADFPEEPTPQQLAEVAHDITDQMTPIIEGQLADLRDLAAPEGDEDLLAALFDDVEAVLDELNQVADDAVAGDPAAIELIASDEDPFDEVNTRAIEYGLTVCGEG